jgi:hypothetical protein
MSVHAVGTNAELPLAGDPVGLRHFWPRGRDGTPIEESAV